jgi:hypothetical protein
MLGNPDVWRGDTRMTWMKSRVKKTKLSQPLHEVRVGNMMVILPWISSRVNIEKPLDQLGVKRSKI